MNTLLFVVDVFLDALGKFAVFFICGVGSEFQVLRDIFAHVDDGTPPKLLYWTDGNHQRII